MLCCFAVFAHAQVKDTLTEVQIKGRKKELRSTDVRVQDFSPGQQVITIDSAVLKQYQLQSLSNLLSQQVPVFIKSYGLNGLATLNFRGSSAAQSQVYWDGVPVNNAASGITDVSALPVALINKLHIVYGGSAALWGSGNIGGALLLESEAPEFRDTPGIKYELNADAGSFGQYAAGGKCRLLYRKWFFSTNAVYQDARNNYTYTDEAGIARANDNARLKSIAVLSQLACRPNEKNTIKLSAWYQDDYREIPAALFESASAKKRKDMSVKLLLNWEHRLTKHNDIYFKTALFSDNMHYEDSLTLQHTTNRTQQYFAEAGWNRQYGRHKLLLFTPVQVAALPQDTLTRVQEKYAIAAAYAYTGPHDRFAFSASIRNEWIDGKYIFLPGVNASYRVASWIRLSANVQKTYRNPSLNELYYAPGGNPGLRPEKGWSEDAGYHIQLRYRNLSLQHDITVFNREIKDWIIWFGGAIWTPHNIATVHSRGVDISYLFSYKLKNVRWHLGLKGTYVAATTVSSYLPNDGSIDKQIPYTPNVVAQVNAGAAWEGLYVNLNYAYNGYRYINVDETGLLPAYGTLNVYAGYRFRLAKKSLQLFLQGNNVLNERYTVVAARVMPGFNWFAGIRLGN